MKCCDSKKVIDNLYKNIAVNDRLRESEDSKEIEKKIALSLGYTLEDIENGANLGLGCGNPIQNANLRCGETVLDLGCGKGMDVFKACKIVGKEGFVIGVDRLPEMIERANYIREKKKFLNTKFMVSDIDNLKVESNTVDCVISNCVINLCEDKEKVYSEIFRVLKSGGRISISDIVQFNELPSWVKDEPIFHAT
ncbi:methyltransferase domain-containing protein [Parvimonas micra]|uniref:methyltransferase domain-containing protein n=1 Tax=Parvimonas micra TaxID=33033 RepID=UPI0030CACE8A